MSNYRRAKFCGGYYFFTVVTDKRRKILTTDIARLLLHNAFEKVRDARGYETIAFCLLPEHFHCIWKLPEGDNDFSTRWSLIKKSFTYNYLRTGKTETSQSASRTKHRHRGVWQKRFWEHQIRDESDLQTHVDYIHYNPVKHELVKNLADWPWSTFHKYLENGRYGKINIAQMQQKLNDLFICE